MVDFATNQLANVQTAAICAFVIDYATFSSFFMGHKYFVFTEKALFSMHRATLIQGQDDVVCDALLIQVGIYLRGFHIFHMDIELEPN